MTFAGMESCYGHWVLKDNGNLGLSAMKEFKRVNLYEDPMNFFFFACMRVCMCVHVKVRG